MFSEPWISASCSLGLWEGGIIIIQSELRSFCISGVLYSNHFATYWGQLVQFEEQSLKIPEAEAFVMTCRRAFQFKSFSPQQHRTNDGSFHMFYKENASKMWKNFGFYERKARLAKSCMPPYWLGHFSGCWSAERPQLSNFASRSKELSSLEGEHTGDLYLVGCTQKKMGHLLPFDHGACPSHCTSDFGVPGYNPCEASSPARKLETNELLWCWYWH